MKTLHISVCMLALNLVALPAHAQNTAGLAQTKSKGYLTMDEVLVHTKNSRQLVMIGKQAIRRGEYERAIKVLNKAIQLNYDDIDAHLHLGEALQDKLEDQEEKDPYVFEKCLKEYLLVYRGEVGEEKGLTFKGLGFMTDRFADEERGITAKRNIVKLTGAAPKMWETDTKFIARMLKKEGLNVSGKLVQGTKPEEAQGAPAKNQADAQTHTIH